jgi:hypothetical protein
MTPKHDRLELTDPAAYAAKLRSQLGERDPLDVLAETPEVLRRLVAGVSPQVMRARPFAGKWTPNEILGHLLDAEWVFGYRLRAILCDDKPTIIGMDQEKWVARQQHNDREPAELVEAFTALRRQNVALWKRMTPSDLARSGQHNERGEESLATMLVLEAGHDLSHIDQIQRYLDAKKMQLGLE